MDFELTEEQIMIRELCEQIAEEKMKPRREHYDTSHEFPWDIVKAFADADLFGIMIPEEYGGMGGGVMDLCIAVEELCKVDSGTALSLWLRPTTLWANVACSWRGGNTDIHARRNSGFRKNPPP